jgi:hypothetical protein
VRDECLALVARREALPQFDVLQAAIVAALTLYAYQVSRRANSLRAMAAAVR